jgi:release factor glutamine methyltransferase
MGDAEHRPMVSAAYVERIRQWHENAYQAGKSELRAGQTFEYLGRTIVVPPDVMPITGTSHLLGEAVLAEVRPSDRVLDMGTGSGVNAILAASESNDVVAVDVNPLAVEAARQNAERNGVADRIDVRHSDVFENVDAEFDLMIFDPPFRWFAPRDLFERASTDENYTAMTTFFLDAKRYLRPRGRMLLFFGTSGDLPYLRHLIAETGFDVEVLAQLDFVKDDMRVDYFTFRLTPTTSGTT